MCGTTNLAPVVRLLRFSSLALCPYDISIDIEKVISSSRFDINVESCKQLDLNATVLHLINLAHRV